MKKYSEIIASLAESGGHGASSKGADLAAGVRKTVPIKGSSEKKGHLEENLVYTPAFNGTKLTGGLQI